jgi:inorganic pyrophosphatase
MVMTTPLHRLPAREADSTLVNVVIDTLKGSRNKYKYDEKHGLFLVQQARVC